jgi:hypothetical protein
MVLMVIEDPKDKDNGCVLINNAGTTLGPTSEKTWPKYHPDGTLKKLQTREVNDILPPTNKADKEMAFSVTEASNDKANEDVEVGIICESKLRDFLRKAAAAKKLKAMNVKSWMDALIYKLNDIGMSTVSDLRKELLPYVEPKIERQGSFDVAHEDPHHLCQSCWRSQGTKEINERVSLFSFPN